MKHAAHVGGEIVHGVRTLDRGIAVRLVVQIEHEVFHILKALVPAGLRLDVHRTDAGETLAAQIAHQVAADEAATATNYHEVIFVHICVH